jgi:ATP-dependent protease ClpP protease subunit
MMDIEMRAGTAAQPITLALMGDVGFEITAQNVALALKGVPKGAPLNISINSYGGDALAGIAVHNILARHEGPKRVVIEGIAASAASLIAMAGDEIIMPENAFMMVHEAWGGALGDAETMRQQADMLEKISGAYRRTYAARSGQTEEAVAALMAAETWFTAEDAVANGFATEAAAPAEIRVFASLSPDRYARTPEALRRLVQAAKAAPVAETVFNPPAMVPVIAEEIGMTDTVAQAGGNSPAPSAAPVQAVAVQPISASLADLEGIASRNGLPAEFVLAQAKAGATREAALEAALEAVAQKSPQAYVPGPISQFIHSYDDPANVVDAMATAIAARHMPAVASKVGEGQWRKFAGLRPSDMLIELAQARGERVTSRDREKLIARAFHTTSDFPLLLSNAGNKMLEAGYALASPSYRTFFARRRFNDFKAHSFLTAGDFPSLQALSEGGEIKRGSVSEKREQITPGTYARGVAVTRQMLVNDDLGAFTDFGTMIGRRIADWENATAYGVVNTASGDGPTLAEGSAAVFSTAAGRVNKAGTASAVTAVALGLGFNAIKAQSSMDGLKLNIQPRYLVCSVIQEFVAAQFASSTVVPSGPTNVNPFAGRFEVVSDANLPNNRWYLFADPVAAPVYVYGYVGDNEVPQVRVGQPMGVDGTVVEVVHDFAVGAIDFRGGFFNAGVAPA